jgi:hypothetical protein
MDPKHKSSDAGNLSMPKKSYKVLPLSERWKFQTERKKVKKLHAEVLRSAVGTNLIYPWNCEEKICAGFAHISNTDIIAMILDKCLITMTLNLWVEEMDRRGIPIDSNMLFTEALCLYEDSVRNPLNYMESTHLLQSPDDCTDSG